MRLVFFLLLFSFQLFSIEDAERIEPQPLEKIKINVERTISNIISVPLEKKNYENTLKPLHNLTSDLIENMTLLLHASKNEALEDLKSYLFSSLLNNSHLLETLNAYIQKDRSPYENYLLTHFISHIKDREKKPFVYLKGNLSEKKKTSSFTLLSLNTCFLPGKLSWIHGGVKPWKERLKPLSSKIVSINADIICLQEIFTEEAAFALYEKLRNHYSHFYLSIGPKGVNCNFESCGLPSGLFVASKYKIESAEFIPFSKSSYQINYGLFDFIVKDLGHIYLTHLQAHDYPEARTLQVNEILEKIKRDYLSSSEKVPFILCGDLNIAWNSNEEGEKLIHAYFQDAYNHNRCEVDEFSSTCNDFLTRYFLSKDKKSQTIDPSFQIIDYVLLLTKVPYRDEAVMGSHKITTKRVPMNHIRQPDSALSDHHGLFSTITHD